METIKNNPQSVENLWNALLKDNPNNSIKETPLSFYFCDNKKDADECAEIEGEGDKSLSYWKRVHEAYYKREMQPYGDTFSEDMIIICEYFKTIYVAKPLSRPFKKNR